MRLLLIYLLNAVRYANIIQIHPNNFAILHDCEPNIFNNSTIHGIARHPFCYTTYSQTIESEKWDAHVTSSLQLMIYRILMTLM